MKILYVANHLSGGNDDEGAIFHALTKMGHEVLRITEREGRAATNIDADFVLFHKWHDLPTLRQVRCPKVFWYFDLVAFPDPTLAARCNSRVRWMEDITPLIDLGFCTDGDWVAKDTTNKLVWLTQGADERVVGVGTPKEPRIQILFTGGRNGGRLRSSFVDEMKQLYGDDFRHVERGIHGREMADLIASADIVVAPDGPVTNSYWSNRIYNVCGFGGFLLHPMCYALFNHYGPLEVGWYSSRERLHELIKVYSTCEQVRKDLANRSLEVTKAKHLYRHRCEQLIQTVKERLL